MTEIMPVPRNLNFTVLPAESFAPAFLGSMLVNPGDHRDQRTRLTFCFL